MAALLAELPLLPPLLPGQLDQLLAEAAKEPPAADAAETDAAAGSSADAAAVLAQRQAGSSSLQLPEGQASAAAEAVPAWQQWVAAQRCLKLLKQDQVLGLAELQHGSSSGATGLQAGGTEGALGAARSVQLRCCLVLLGAMSHRDLAPCRVVLLDLPAGSLQQQLLPLMGAASCAAPQAAQVQVLGEVLASGLVCAQPEAALQLAAAMVACLQCQISASSALDGHVSMVPAFEGGAVGALAHALPALLREEGWAPAAEALVGALVKVVKRVEGQGSGLEAAAGALAGLVGVRDLVPGQVCAEVLPWLAAVQT
jgi:hypothetical protein